MTQRYFLVLLVIVFLASSCAMRPHTYRQLQSSDSLSDADVFFVQDNENWLDVSFTREKWIIPQAGAANFFALSITGLSNAGKVAGGLGLGTLITWGGYTWSKEVDQNKAHQLKQCLVADEFQGQLQKEYDRSAVKAERGSLLTIAPQTQVTAVTPTELMLPLFQSSSSAETKYRIAIVYQLNFAREKITGDPMPQIVYRLVVYDNRSQMIEHDERVIVSQSNEFSYSWELLERNDCALVKEMLEPLLVKATHDICSRLGIECRKRKVHTSRSSWGRFKRRR